MELGALRHHRAYRAVLLFRQLDRVFHRLARNLVASEDVLKVHVGEDLRWVQWVVRFDLHFVTSKLRFLRSRSRQASADVL